MNVFAPARFLGLIALALIATPSPSSGQAVPPGVDLSKLAGVCDYVYQNHREDAPSPYGYGYERKIFEAAGVSPSEFERSTRLPAPVIQKIQRMWRHALAQGRKGPLKCDTANFDVPHGYILKYAIKMQNFRFLAAAAQLWKVDLNVVDEWDNKTVLDYIEDEMARFKEGDEELESLRTYHRILVKAGAKKRVAL